MENKSMFPGVFLNVLAPLMFNGNRIESAPGIRTVMRERARVRG